VATVMMAIIGIMISRIIFPIPISSFHWLWFGGRLLTTNRRYWFRIRLRFAYFRCDRRRAGKCHQGRYYGSLGWQ
jgi:hypothetical protein